MFAALLLAAGVVETAVISSPQIGTFFSLPSWMPTEVTADRTFGSCEATNMTHRVDETALAAVNACFEAYCERNYFVHAGQSNVWDVVTYGPRCSGSDKHEFRFDLPYATSPWSYAPDTNRVVRTRRLSEYSNIYDLAWSLLAAPNGRIACDFPAVIRPNWWLNDDGTGDYISEPSVYWSTTLLDGLDTNYGIVGDPFPVVSWSQAVVFCASQPDRWVACAPHLRQVANGDVTGWRDESVEGYARNIAWIAADDVGMPDALFGQTNRSAYIEEFVSITNTSDDIIGKGAFVTYITQKTVTNHVNVTLSVKDLQSTMAIDNVSRCISYSIDGDSWSGMIEINYASFSGPATEGGSELTVTFKAIGNGLSVSVPDGHSLTTDIDPDTVYSVSARSFGVNVQYSELGISDPAPYAPSSAKDEIVGVLDVVCHIPVTNIVHNPVGVEGLTNDTRRLVKDRLSGIGLTLGALDRTYARIKAPMPSVVTQFYHSAYRDYRSEIDVSTSAFAWDALNREWYVDISGQDFPTLTEERSGSQNMATGFTTYDEGYLKYVTDAGLQFEYGATPDMGNLDTGIYLTQRDVEEIISNGPVEDGWRFHIHFTGCGMEGDGRPFVTVRVSEYEGRTEYYANQRLEGYPPVGEQAKIVASARSRTSYDNGHTVGEPQWTHGYKSYPGNFSRVSPTSKPKLWAMMKAHSTFGDANHRISPSKVSETPQYESSWASNYRILYATQASEYQSSYGMFASFATIYQSLVGKCDGLFGEHVDVNHINSPLVILGRVEQGLVERQTLSSFALDAGSRITAIFAKTILPDVQTGEYPDSIVCNYDKNVGVVIECVNMMSPDGTLRPVYYFPPGGLQVGHWDYDVQGLYLKSGHTPTDHTAYGCIVNGRLSPWSKVDWDWHALKRTKKSN